MNLLCWRLHRHRVCHVLHVISIGHFAATPDSLFTQTGLWDQQGLPRVLVVITTADHLEVAQQRKARQGLSLVVRPDITRKLHVQICPSGQPRMLRATQPHGATQDPQHTGFGRKFQAVTAAKLGIVPPRL